MKNLWENEIETLSADWQRTLHKAATTTDPEIRNIYTELSNSYQGQVQKLRLKIREAKGN